MRMSVIIFIMVYCSCYRGQWPREMREIPRVRDFPRLGQASRSFEKAHSAPLGATLDQTLLSLFIFNCKYDIGHKVPF